MHSAKNVSRIIALCFLAQMIFSMAINIGLLGPVFQAPGFLLNAAPHATLVSLSALLGIAGGLLGIAVALLIWPFFRRHSLPLAMAYIALVLVQFAVHVFENISLLTMLSLSQAYLKASLAERDTLQAMRVVVTALRNWSHYLALILAGCSLFVLYGNLWRYQLVPRLLAGFGMLAACSQMISVTLPLFGESVIFAMLAPIGICQLLLMIYLAVKGLPEQA